MKKFKIGLIIGIIILISIIVIGIKLFMSAGEAFDEMFVIDGNSEIINIEDDENTVSGTGTITSFNIEHLDTTLWTKTDKVLVNNEDVVTANQEILNVSNDVSNGKIYSTIAGKIFIEDSGFGKKYTIYDLNNLGFELQVPEEKSKDLKIGQAVECLLKSSNETITGRVCYISYIPQDKQITVKVKVENTEKVKIGYTVSAKILLDSMPDETTQIYDIKNSVPKIGKTIVTYKNTGEQVDFSSFEELFEDDELINMYEEALAEQQAIIEELSNQLEQLTEGMEMEVPTEENNDNSVIEPNTDQISDYYNGYWKEYWEEFYKAKIMELQKDQTESNNESSSQGQNEDSNESVTEEQNQPKEP